MQVNRTIKDFNKKMVFYRENPNLKSAENVSVDSAIWLLESTINYFHSFPAETYYEMEMDTIILVVPKSSTDEVNLIVLTQKYYEMKDEITNVYNNLPFTEIWQDFG